MEPGDGDEDFDDNLDEDIDEHKDDIDAEHEEEDDAVPERKVEEIVGDDGFYF